MVDVLTVGEALVALRSDGLVRLGGALQVSVAGAESNVAIGLARLGHHARWMGVVGDDQFGALVTRVLRAEGVDLTAVRSTAAPTGIIVFESRLPGLTRVDYHRTGSAGTHLSAADVAASFDPVPRALHVTGVTLALGAGPVRAVQTAVGTARQAGALVCLDVNYRSRLWSAEQAAHVLRPIAPMADIVVASPDELGLAAPTDDPRVSAQVDALLAAGVAEVVVKLGAEGAEAYTADGHVRCAARRVVAVDTIGAGDAFTAGYLSGWLDGLPVGERLHRAVTVGAFAVAARGDWEGVPYRDELSLLDQGEGAVVR